jgi:hypothetical protein
MRTTLIEAFEVAFEGARLQQRLDLKVTSKDAAGRQTSETAVTDIARPSYYRPFLPSNKVARSASTAPML